MRTRPSAAGNRPPHELKLSRPYYLSSSFYVFFFIFPKEMVCLDEKLVLIVNGKPRAGKDTFAILLNKLQKVYKYSIIDKVKTIALDCGWKGGKTEKDRKFLADLKQLTTIYSDMSYNDVAEKVEAFYNDDIKEKIMIIDMREPDDIIRAVCEFNAISIFIKNDNVPEITSNEADANVEDCWYDYYITNNGTIEEFEKIVKAFYYNILMKL